MCIDRTRPKWPRAPSNFALKTTSKIPSRNMANAKKQIINSKLLNKILLMLVLLLFSEKKTNITCDSAQKFNLNRGYDFAKREKNAAGSKKSWIIWYTQPHNQRNPISTATPFIPTFNSVSNGGAAPYLAHPKTD